jgi:acetyl esterase/lipase
MKRTMLVLLRGAIGVALAVALLPAMRASAERAGQNPQASPPATAAPPAAAMTPDGKRVLTLADYGPWKRITTTALSDDGKWMAYTLTPNDGDETLVIKNLDGAAVYTIPIGLPAAAGRGGGRGGAGGGASVQFSDDSRWIAYYVNPPSPPPGRGRGTAAGPGGGAGPTGGPGGGRSGGRTGAPAAGGGASGSAPVRHLELFDLLIGGKVDVPNAGAFQFSKGSQWIAIKMNAVNAASASDAASANGRGTDLLLRRLATGSTENIGNVSLYDFDESGAWLAYAVDAENHLGNGVYAVNLATGDTRALDNAAQTYDGLAWAAGSKHLVALRGDTPKGKTQRENTLVFWSDASQSSAIVWDPSSVASFPKGFVVSEASAPRWARDGSRVFIGIKPQSDLVVESTEPKANLDIWHWKDVELQSEQILRVAQARRATYASVFDVTSQSFVRLTDNALETITPTANGRLAIARDPSPYDHDFSEGQPNRADYYRVDTTTGTRTLVAKHLVRTMGSSPDSRWFLYQEGPQLTAFNLETGKATAIGGPESARFINTDDDHAAEKPVWGVAGWSKDGKAVLLDDKHDVWSVPLDGGKPVAITGGVGAAQSVELRLTRVLTGGGAGGGRGGRGGGAGPATDEGIDLTQPQTFTATGEWTKKSGFWRTSAGSTQPAPIIWLDKNVGGVEKAKNADRVIFTEQTFQEFPDYWVSDSNFTSPRKVTDANPQISDYAWGSRTLVDFTNSKGRKLQATLTLPAGYQPGKKYPMLVYIYETLSNTHHDFSMPVYDDRPHMSEYASSGYLVLEPDIVYEIGRPGSSALDCVTAAVKRVIDLGYADPAHIGLQGHSWGGYESSFILTQTNIFAAVVTGAPLTDLISMYGEIYKQTGTWNGGILETSQGRMGANVTPWNARDLYESQSPLFSVTKIQTPFLILQGTADGAVDWDQGLEFYQAARKNGKQVIFLSYPDEPHHLAKTPNQKDFQVRMKQFFDHYLLGSPEPDWMKNGLPQTEKK